MPFVLSAAADVNVSAHAGLYENRRWALGEIYFKMRIRKKKGKSPPQRRRGRRGKILLFVGRRRQIIEAPLETFFWSNCRAGIRKYISDCGKT